MIVTICSLNSKYIHSSLAPWCLLAGVKEYCNDALTSGKLDVQIIEGTINQPLEVIKDKIVATTPTVVALSCYIWNIKSIYTLIEMIKKELPNVIIALGGPEVSYNTEEVFNNNLDVDYVLSGEGEVPFAVLCKYLLNPVDDCSENELNVDVLNEYGIATRISQNVLPYVLKEMPPTPYGDEYFNAINGRIAYIETSRGCPFRCAFCLSGRCGGVRNFSLEYAKEQIIKLANCGSQTIKFVDRTFNADRSRAKEIWQFIIEHYGVDIPYGVCFHFEIAGDLLDDECFEILNAAPVGLMQMEVGLQSFNEKTLESINRKTNIDKLSKNIKRLLAPNNIHVHIDLIAGLSFEDYESFKTGFDKAYKLKPHMLQLGFLKLLHGADMRENADEYPCIYDAHAPYEVKSTPWLSEADLKKLHGIEDVLDRVANSGRFKRSIEYICNAFIANGKNYSYVYEIFADYLADKSIERITLDDYTQLFYEFFKGQLVLILGENSALCLRDLIVEDRLTTNASGRLPKCLEIYDKSLKKVRIALESKNETKSKKGVKRSVALLYTQNRIICVDYDHKNPVDGTYKANYYGFDIIDEKRE